MKNLNGGYVMLDLSSSTIYEDAELLLKTKKPILVYPLEGIPYYATSLSYTEGATYILLDNTIHINNDNTITTETDDTDDDTDDSSD